MPSPALCLEISFHKHNMLSSLPTRSSLLQLLISLFSIYILYRFTKFCVTKRRYDRLAVSLGCKPTKKWRTLDPFYGLDYVYEQYKAFRAGAVLDRMASRYTELGCRTARFDALGYTVIGTIEPANIRTVLATDFPSWSLPDMRKTHLGEFLGQSIFTTDGEAWKHSRELIRPSFARSRIEDVEGNLEKHCQRLIDCIRPGEEVDLQPLFFAFTMDVASEFLLGESSDMLVRIRRTMEGEKIGEEDATTDGGAKASTEPEEVTAEDFVEAFTYAQAAAEGAADNDDDWKWLGFLRTFLPNRKVKKCYSIINRYIDNIVTKALSHPSPKGEPDHPTFLTTLISQTRNPLKLRAELLSTLLASRDTTASLLSNVWFELSRRPTIWIRLRRDIASTLSPATSSSSSNKEEVVVVVVEEEALPTEPPTYTHLKSLRYLTALLKESLRLFPIVAANARQANVDTTLPFGGGPEEKDPVFVRKGTHLHWNLWGMHRRRDLYGEDAEEFRVERWLDDEPLDVGEEDDAHHKGDDDDDDDDDDGGDDAHEVGSTTGGSASDHDEKPTRKRRGKGLRVGWEFLPFNGGPRICVGQQFALAEAAYVTVRLMQAFSSVESRGDPGPWVERVGLTVTGKNGARVVLR